MVTVLRFYGELNDFLPPERRGRPFAHTLPAAASVKDTIEALGVPHPEVDLIVVNGTAVGFEHPVRDGDRIAVYPCFHSIDLGPVRRVGGPAPEPIRFAADVHLGKLAARLRLAGFDVIILTDDRALARVSAGEGRITLTRDRELLKRNLVRHGRWIRNTAPDRQFVEVLQRYGQASRLRPFTRRLRCNDRLEPVARELVADRVPPRARARFRRFQACRGCGRLYWCGSHYWRLRAYLDRARHEANAASSAESPRRISA